MKKRVLSVVIAGILLAGTFFPTINANATPEAEAKEARAKYEELNEKINGINEKIQALDSEIIPIIDKMNSNEAQIKSINVEIENTNKEIDTAKEEISDQEDLLGGRLREMYKSGGEVSYLSILFSSDSLSDLIGKITSAKRVVDLDNEMIDELNEKKDKLDDKVVSLEEKSEEIEEINEELKEQKLELDEKREEQEVLVAEVKVERAEFDRLYLATAERELVKSILNEGQASGKDSSYYDSYITRLRSIRDNQIKSPTVVEEMNEVIEKIKVMKSNAKAAEEASLSRGQGVTATGTAEAIIDEAYKHLGKAYVYGATGPSNFDCSGFTSYVYRLAAGVNIGRTTYNQISSGREVSYSELQPGDLVFPHADHVGIYIGNGQMIHAPQTGDVVKVAPVYKFWRGRRILN